MNIAQVFFLLFAPFSVSGKGAESSRISVELQECTGANEECTGANEECTGANEAQIRKKDLGQCSLSELKVPCKNIGSLEFTDANEECTDANANKSVRVQTKRKSEKKTWGSVL